MEKNKIEDFFTDQGLLVNGIGSLLNKFDKLLEVMEKVDKKLFFLEKRQQKVAELEHPELKEKY